MSVDLVIFNIYTHFIFYVYLPNIPEIDLIACTTHVILGTNVT